MENLEQAIAQRIRQSEQQRITFAEFMEMALYHPQFGYYATPGSIIGAQGDFVTSPHMGSDFGELIAEQFADMWEVLGQPDEFTVMEMGAGQGLVAGDAIAATDFLITNEFWLSGYVDMAVSPLTSVPVMAFTQDPRGHAVWFTPTDWLGYSGVFITIADYEQPQIRATYAPYFERFDLLDTLETQRAGVTTETFYLYDVGKLVLPYPYPY